MKKFIFLSLILALTIQLNAAEKYIHFWQVNNTIWMSGIQLTNICEDESVTVTLQLWNSNGNYFANHKIGEVINNLNQITTTDSDGKIELTLNSNQTAGFFINTSMVDSYQNGSGKVTSLTSSGKSCLIGGYSMERTDNGASYAFVFNNAIPF